MTAEKLINAARWIWLPDYDDVKEEAKFVLFRKTFVLDVFPSGPQYVRVTADTRYRMFVNGHRASFGPCKSYLSRWYFDEIDINPFLRSGKNVIAIKVLRFSPVHIGNSSMIRGPVPGLILQGSADEVSLDTNESWRVIEDESVKIIPRTEWNYALGPPFMCLNERCNQISAKVGWTSTDFNDSHWMQAVFLSMRSMMLPILEPRKLYERPIPELPEIERKFTRSVKSDGNIALDKWNDFLRGRGQIDVAAGARETVDIETNVLTTGFLQLYYNSGVGSKITILCAESYERRHTKALGKIGAERFKADRKDFQNGELYGPVDVLTTTSGENISEPFWFRTFRFVRLTVEASADQPLTLKSLTFRETHYPLEIETHLEKTTCLDDLWEISLNTLRNCMHETYEDCPFYEQNQFAMDARIQILFTYQLSHDDRLARKCIHEFYASRRDDGLVETHFPVPFRAINIPQFSLYWVLMVCDHFEYFSDAGMARQYLGTIDGVLNHFLQRREERGLVGRFDAETWPFVDWVKEWHGTGGLQTMAIPPCYHSGDGVVTYNSLITAYTLQQAAVLNAALGRNCIADEYRGYARSLTAAVNQHCWDGEMYVDGPSTSARCQHSQVFAVLAGAIDGDSAAKLMQRSLLADIPKCSYAMSFYVLRAASCVGLYEEHHFQLMQPWRKMINQNLTTWAEDDVMFRSDCHGWSASPIYEIVHEIFGVSPAMPGYRKVRIAPRFALQDEAKGIFVVGEGVVRIAWTRGEKVSIESSKDIEAEIVIKGESSLLLLRAGKSVCLPV